MRRATNTEIGERSATAMPNSGTHRAGGGRRSPSSDRKIHRLQQPSEILLRLYRLSVGGVTMDKRSFQNETTLVTISGRENDGGKAHRRRIPGLRAGDGRQYRIQELILGIKQVIY